MIQLGKVRMTRTKTADRPVRYIPPRVLTMARENREWARKAGPVIVVRAMRCECGGWMRPGVNHVCQDRPTGWRHIVRHITGQPARCECGWVTPVPVDQTRVEQVAKRHLLAGEDRRVGGTRW
jgi:hypothetical protein